jgi:FdhD protein
MMRRISVMDEAFRQFDVVRVEHRRAAVAADRVAVEAGLEVRLEGEPFSVIMRTPGADGDLATGFLFAEGVIRGADDIRLVEIVEPNVVNIRLSRDRTEILPELLGQRRQVVTNASCGMCGRRTLASLAIELPPLVARWKVPEELVLGLPSSLRAAQSAFVETGGLHAAGLFDLEGGLELSAEDVGRHNAVDKLIGRMVHNRRLPLERSMLFVSGRTSFEIVQKAFLGGVPFVGAVSAPSSLAIDLARETGITLLGFVRDGRFNVYSHAERVEVA